MDQQPGDSFDQRGPSGIVLTTITPDPGSAEYEFLEVVAELEGKAIEDLPSLYDQLDHFIELLFEVPPALEAQIELSFSYSGHRVRLTQDGQLTLVQVKSSIVTD